MASRSKSFSIILLLLVFNQPAQSQVLISLLFGDALNSDKVEFGLNGGFNRSKFYNMPEAEGLNSFNLGFYFHLKVANTSYISTGVMVKSTIGSSGLMPYTLNNAALDTAFQNGNLTKKISCFYVPILFQQRLFDDRWYIEAGGMPGLRTKGTDIFDNSIQDGDLNYELDVRDQFTRLDFGLMGGVGFKFKKNVKSTSVGASYYYGLVNISTVPNETYKNSSWYVYVKIPIGVGSKEAAQ